MAIRLGLKCDACGEQAVGVASSCIPMSFAYCKKCLLNHAEPEFIFAYHYDDVSNDGKGLADWFTQGVKIFKDGEYWNWNRYVEWRHATGQGKSKPCEYPEPSDEPIDFSEDDFLEEISEWIKKN